MLDERGKLCWHIHHDVLLEMAMGPLQSRVDAILSLKPLAERETRLRLMKPVGGKLPKEVVKAAREYRRAWEEVEATEKAVNRGEYGNLILQKDRKRAVDVEYTKEGKFNDTIRGHMLEIIALHAIECPDCPWDGETIFPRTEVT